jgi:hypothetical protein
VGYGGQAVEDGLSGRYVPLRPNVRLAFIGALLALYRLPFLLTHAIVDDAFITWRCAVQLADTGVYGFNPGERVSASTSHAYVGLVALLRLVFRGAYIPATLALNTLLVVVGLFLVCDCLCPDRRVRDACWVLTALTPLALIVSIAGMETALLVFTLALALWGFERNERAPGYALVAIGALPWIRLDAVFAAGVIALAQGYRSRRAFGTAALAAVVGAAAVTFFNAAYFGVVVNQSILAKLGGLEDALGPRDVILRVVGIYFTTADARSAFMPLPTKYLAFTGPLFAALTFLGFGLFLRREPRGSARAPVLMALAVLSLVPPALYAAGAVMYAWYFWPSVTLSGAVLLALALETSLRAGPRRFAAAAGGLGLVVAVSGVAEWGVSFSAGQEHEYFASVGRFVAAWKRAGDTLFSDTAGSVPYFAGLATDDDVGLVSPAVTRYRKTLGDGWRAAFLRARRPTWIVVHNPLGELVDDPPGDANGSWVLAHYPLVKSFNYASREAPSNPGLLRLARLGSASDVFVYKLAEETN